MESNLIQVQGSVTKDVKLKKVNYRVLENTCVAEVVEPYADYYGSFPFTSKPNSLYLFTKTFYTLDEVLKVMNDCKDFFGYTKDIDVATAILDYRDHYHYTIRISEFPDYEHIEWLQTCFNYEGVDFCKKVQFSDIAKATVFKTFDLRQMAEGVFLDCRNERKGYISIPAQVDGEEFKEILINIRNNNDCELFDAAIGTIEVDANTKCMIRIFSENLNIALLNCVKTKFTKHYLRLALQHH